MKQSLYTLTMTMIGLLLRKKQLKQLIKATNLCNCQNWGSVTGVKVRMWKKPYSSASKITELSEDWCQGGTKLVSKHLKNAPIEHKSEDWPQMRRYVLSGKSLTKAFQVSPKNQSTCSSFSREEHASRKILTEGGNYSEAATISKNTPSPLPGFERHLW